VQNALGYTILVLMLVAFLIHIAVDVLLRPIFKRLYDQEKKLVFWNKIKWLKNNASSFDIKDVKRINVIVLMMRISICTYILAMVLFFILNASQ